MKVITTITTARSIHGLDCIAVVHARFKFLVVIEHFVSRNTSNLYTVTLNDELLGTFNPALFQ
ncbi:hypothetical protein D3C74_321830 [compost metagenome]